ncbi:MAG: hypothetical protein HZB71_13055 [Betaproteobacteria bacterium]|nr:hypothetical protein [Betaproteobacteria bacterium]
MTVSGGLPGTPSAAGIGTGASPQLAISEATERLTSSMKGGQIGIVMCGMANRPSGVGADARCQVVLQ